MSGEDELTELAIANVVDSIDGVTDRVIDGLDDEFGDAYAVASASPNELQRIDGIGPAIAGRIYRRTDFAKIHPEFHLGEEPKRRIRR